MRRNPIGPAHEAHCFKPKRGLPPSSGDECAECRAPPTPPLLEDGKAPPPHTEHGARQGGGAVPPLPLPHPSKIIEGFPLRQPYKAMGRMHAANASNRSCGNADNSGSPPHRSASADIGKSIASVWWRTAEALRRRK